MASLADLLFILFGFSCIAYVERTPVLLVWSNPTQSNRRSYSDTIPYGEGSLSWACCITYLKFVAMILLADGG